MRLPHHRNPRTLLTTVIMVYGILGAYDLVPFRWITAEAASVKKHSQMASITDIHVDPKTLYLVIHVQDGTFDPVLSLRPLHNNQYEIIMEGENVQLAPILEQRSQEVRDAITQHIAEVHAVKFSEKKHGTTTTTRLILFLNTPLKPRIRSNNIESLTIELKGATPTLPVKPKKPLHISPTLAPKIAPEISPSFKPIVPPSSQPQSHQETTPIAASTSIPGKATSNGSSSNSPQDSIYSLISDAGTSDTVRMAWGDIQQGNLLKARTNLEFYLKRHTKDPLASLLLAETHLAEDSSDNLRNALTILEGLTADYPKFMPGWMERIHLSMMLNPAHQTQVLVSQARIQWPDNPELLYLEGYLHEKSNRLSEAEDNYLKALSMTPNNPTYHHRLAIVALKQNRTESAVLELQKALLLDPDNTATRKVLGYLSQKNQNPIIAQEHYLESMNPDAWINYASLLQDQGRQTDALSIYQAVERITEDDANIQYNLGMLYWKMKQPDHAERTLTRFIDLQQNTDDKRFERQVSLARQTLERIHQTQGF